MKVKDHVERRVIAVILHVEGAWSVRKACEKAGFSRTSFVMNKWAEKYRDGGLEAVLKARDHQGGLSFKMTPGSQELAMHLEKVLAEVVAQNGYDTKYM